MNSSENNTNFESFSQPEETPKSNGSKKKGLLIGAVIAAAVLAIVGIVMAIVLSNRYLEKVKDFYPVDTMSFNGYEVVNDDGLYYLTKDGKKVSRNGYTMIKSLSADYYEQIIRSEGEGVLAFAEDTKIYDYFLARKEESSNYFIVNGEGEELMIAGESWEYEETILPFVIFEDSVTGEYGTLSLENMDSDISAVSGSELELRAFDDYDAEMLGEKNILAGVLLLEDEDAGVDSPRNYFVNANGTIMFKSAYDYETEEIELDNGSYRVFVLTSEGVLYDISGNKLQENVIDIFSTGDCVFVYRNPDKDNPEAINSGELVVYSQNASFSISNADYSILDRHYEGNLLWAKARNAEDYTMFNLSTGEKTTYQDVSVINGIDNILTCKTANGFNYVDTETGKTVLMSQYGDMIGYSFFPGVLYSPSQPMTDNASYILHFVAAGKSAVNKTLYNNQSIELVFDYGEGNSAYKITTTDTTSNVVRYSIYAPFSSNLNKNYDEIQIVNAFAEGAPVALATNYDENSFDFIDVANGQVVYSVVNASAEKMALTTVSYVETHALFADYDKGVEFAVFKTTVKDTNKDGVSEKFYAFSRGEVMTEGEEAKSTAPLKMTDLGDNVDSITASTKSLHSWQNASKYMAVKTSHASTDIYEITSEYQLEKLATVPYGAVSFNKYGDALEQVYLKVRNSEDSSELALYTVGGEMILGFHADIEVSSDGEYIIAKRNGVYGAYKYDAEKGRIKQVLDYNYSYIDFVGDGGFLVRETIGGDYYLYDGKSPAKPDPVTNVIYCRMISWDEEAGKFVKSVNTYYNIAGKLYVHRGEGEELIYTEIIGTVCNEAGKTVSYAPTLIKFHDTDGKLIETKLIYFTKKDEFQMPVGTWYKVGTKDLQNGETLVTEKAIKTYDYEGMCPRGGVINLYKGHTADTAN